MVPGEGVEPSRACAQRFLSSPEARHQRSPSVTSGASSATWTHRRLRPSDTWCHLEAHGVGTKLTHSLAWSQPRAVKQRGLSTFEFQLSVTAPLNAGDLVRVQSALV